MSVWQGADLKFLVEITAEGFDITRDDYRIVLKRGNKEIEVAKSAIVENEGEYCFLGMVVLSLVKELVIDKKIDWVDLIAGIVGGMVTFLAYLPKDWIL